MSNGLHAQQSGKRLENYAAEVLDDLGYSQVQSKLFFDLKDQTENAIYARQCFAGTSLSGRRRRVNIILYHPEKWTDCLVIQCKWQSEKGTADEKYPFEVLSINKNPYPTIIILEGTGYRPKSKEWLRSQAGKGKLLQVCSLGEFDRFAKRNL